MANKGYPLRLFSPMDLFEAFEIEDQLLINQKLSKTNLRDQK
jgi:hypothetical protein